MSTVIKQMQINAGADAGLTAAFARHAAGRAVAASEPGAIQRLALRVPAFASRDDEGTVPAPA